MNYRLILLVVIFQSFCVNSVVVLGYDGMAFSPKLRASGFRLTGSIFARNEYFESGWESSLRGLKIVDNCRMHEIAEMECTAFLGLSKDKWNLKYGITGSTKTTQMTIISQGCGISNKVFYNSFFVGIYLRNLFKKRNTYISDLCVQISKSISKNSSLLFKIKYSILAKICKLSLGAFSEFHSVQVSQNNNYENIDLGIIASISCL